MIVSDQEIGIYMLAAQGFCSVFVIGTHRLVQDLYVQTIKHVAISAVPLCSFFAIVTVVHLFVVPCFRIMINIEVDRNVVSEYSC